MLQAENDHSLQTAMALRQNIKFMEKSVFVPTVLSI